MSKPTQFDVDAAKQFFKNRIIASAAQRQVTLSEAEIATLTYSEPTADEHERELADEVDAKLGADRYEKKIADLVRDAYRDDVSRGAEAEWRQHLNALRYEDLYVLVMLRAAGIAGTPSGLAAITQSFLRPDTVLLGVVGMAGLVLFFAPLRSFLRTDLVRGAAFVAWLVMLWLVGAWSKRRAVRIPR